MNMNLSTQYSCRVIFDDQDDYGYQIYRRGDGEPVTSGIAPTPDEARSAALTAITALDWQDCIPADPGWFPLPMMTVDPDYFPF